MLARSVFPLGIATMLLSSGVVFAQMSAADENAPVLPPWARGAAAARHPASELENQFDRAFSALNAPRSQFSQAATVTVHELSHEIPGKALKEYDKANKATGKGDRAAAIEHLKKAVAIDPEFCEAYNDLGANYLVTNHVEQAIASFNKVIAVDPHAALPYSNLVVAFLMQNKYADAERAARQELDLDRGSTRGRLMLGMALVLQQKFTPEAEINLKKAAYDFPQARLLLARLLAAQGQLDPAKDQLRRYLASGDPSAADIAKDWIHQLDMATQHQ